MQNASSQKPLYKPALIGLVLTLISIIIAISAPLGTRIGSLGWGFGMSVSIMKWAAGLGIVSILMCLSGLVFARPGSGRRGFGYGLVGLAIVVPMMVVLLTWWNAKRTMPHIEDISTNLEQPLTFWDAPNSRIYGGEENAALQEEFYPEIKPLVLHLPADRVFELVVKIIEDRGWTVWNPGHDELHVEATERTFWFGYSDDVTIQVTPIDENTSQVDMRSASRFGGGGDGGTNAHRIQAFFADLADAAAE